MARRVDSDGNSLNKDGRLRPTAFSRRDVDVDAERNPFSTMMAESKLLTDVMAFFCDHDGGHLKVRRATDSSDLHLTWTWSMGKHSGSYVYVRVEYWRLLFGLDLLRIKVLEAEEGLRPPTPDKYTRSNT